MRPGEVDRLEGELQSLLVRSSTVYSLMRLFNESAEEEGGEVETPPDTHKGKRRKNRLPDKGEANTVVENPAGTTRKKYGPDGNVQKEWNQGHGQNAPADEQKDHMHDYKPNPNNPTGRGERMPARKPRPRDLFDMDFLK